MNSGSNSKSSFRTRVYLTVDVEISMGGAWSHPDRRPLSIDKLVFCRIGENRYGLPLIVEELNKYGLRATFFTEVFFSYCLGTDQAKVVIDYLLKNRQDVQLHLHPVFRNYWLASKDGTAESFNRYRMAGDSFSGSALETQQTLLSEGADLFKSLAGVFPTAFRAGGFHGDANTLTALKRVGIPIDSSYNPSVAASFPNKQPQPNVVQTLNGTIEMPLTVAMSGLAGFESWKPLAISSLSFAELRTVLTQARAAGLQDIVMIFHSFSMVKPRDMFYSSLRPDRIVISRFRRLLQFLAEHQNMFEVRTIQDAPIDDPTFGLPKQTSRLNLGFMKPLVRKGEQALNRLYWV